MDNSHLPLPSELNLSKEETDIVSAALGHPSVQKYLRLLHYNAILDLSQNEAETTEQVTKLAARFNKQKGILYVVSFLVNNFSKDKV